MPAVTTPRSRSGFAPRFTVLGNLTSLNGRFTTGRFGHTVAFGVTGYQFKTYSDFVNPPAASVRLGSASIANPVVFGLPPAGIPTHTNIFNSGMINQQGFNMVDSIALTRRWSTRIAISQDWIWTNNYNNAGVRTGGYKDNGLSPLASLLFKPTSRHDALRHLRQQPAARRHRADDGEQRQRGAAAVSQHPDGSRLQDRVSADRSRHRRVPDQPAVCA